MVTSRIMFDNVLELFKLTSDFQNNISVFGTAGAATGRLREKDRRRPSVRIWKIHLFPFTKSIETKLKKILGNLYTQHELSGLTVSTLRDRRSPHSFLLFTMALTFAVIVVVVRRRLVARHDNVGRRDGGRGE